MKPLKRRDFLSSSAGAFAGITATVAASRQKLALGQGTDVAYATNTGDGVRIHDFESHVMQGFPPPPHQIVTRSSQLRDRNHRVWAQQHASELYTTHCISRGSGTVRHLPRQLRELDSIPVTGSQGRKVRLIDLLLESHTDAFLVLRDGKIINEQYFSGMRPETRHQLHSASKSVSVGVVFNLLHEGAFKESTHVSNLVPELAESGFRGATVRHLLDMQSGVQYDYQDGNVINDTEELDISLREGGRHYRMAGFFPTLPGEDPQAGQYDFLPTLGASKDRIHGEKLYYKCCDTSALAWACEKLTGQRFADLLSKYVWSKLGTERDALIISDNKGACSPYSGISMTLRDFARWGLVHAESGRWDGRQIIPETFIDDIQRNHDSSKITPTSFLSSDHLLEGSAYRSQFWIPGPQNDAFFAGGAYGQYCYIHPNSKTVIVRFATEQPSVGGPEWIKILLTVFYELIQALEA